MRFVRAVVLAFALLGAFAAGVGTLSIVLRTLTMSIGWWQAAYAVVVLVLLGGAVAWLGKDEV